MLATPDLAGIWPVFASLAGAVTSNPTPVAVNAGFGWTAAGVWTAVLMLVGIVIRQIGPWRKQTIEAEQRLRDDLLGRVTRLEQVRDRERRRHEAERALDRHRLNNVTQCFDALLLLIEAAPEKASDTVARIKEMRATQLKAESLEKAAIHAVDIAEEAEAL
jgi:hypothetical protein